MLRSAVPRAAAQVRCDGSAAVNPAGLLAGCPALGKNRFQDLRGCRDRKSCGSW